MATHLSVLAWRIPWTGELGEPQSIGSQRVRHNSSNLAVAPKSLQSCPTLCDPMECSLPGFSVHGILQARTLRWVAISFSEHVCVHAKLLQSCLTLYNPMDCRLPGSSVQRILQARILEWVAMLFSRGSSPPRD